MVNVNLYRTQLAANSHAVDVERKEVLLNLRSETNRVDQAASWGRTRFEDTDVGERYYD